MQLISAMTYREDGTTSVTIVRKEGEETYTLDNSQSKENQPKYIYRGGKSEIKNGSHLEVNGLEEKELYQDIRSFFEELFGKESISALLSSLDKKRPSEEGNLFCGLNFLILMEKERNFGKRVKFPDFNL